MQRIFVIALIAFYHLQRRDPFKAANDLHANICSETGEEQDLEYIEIYYFILVLLTFICHIILVCVCV